MCTIVASRYGTAESEEIQMAETSTRAQREILMPSIVYQVHITTAVRRDCDID